MPDPSIEYPDQFLRRVHRRQTVVRLAECAGLGLSGACVLAVVLVPVLLWRGQSAWGLVGWAAGGGLVVGTAWGLRRRPTLLDAATEADRQLGLADLLGTAVTCRPAAGGAAPADPWAAIVVAVAGARCRTLSASAVAVHRLGVRAWGGISLGAAITLALASLSTHPAGPRAGDDRARAQAAPPRAARVKPPDDRPLVAMPWSPPPRRPAAASEEAGDGRQPDSSLGRDQPETPPGAGDGGRPQTGDPVPTKPGVAAAGDGTAPGTPRDPVDASRDPERSPSAEAGDATRAAGSAPAGGAGQSTADGLPSSDPSSMDVAEPTSSSDTLPWQSNQWPADAHRAGEAVRAGRVPDRYRDFIRQYFDRTQHESDTEP